MRSRITCFLVITMLFLALCVSACAQSSYRSLCEQCEIDGKNVIAWLEIPGMSLCEPVMRHPQDDAYYAKHDAAGRENQIGSLYVQAGYNGADFSDPVTLVYGSSLMEDSLFGRLQEQYSGNFEACRSLYVHLPEEDIEYTVFAALPYSSIHILHYYDFGIKRRFEGFFDQVFSTRALGMHLVKEDRPDAGKNDVLILSTGLRGDPLQRYLVMAKKTAL